MDENGARVESCEVVKSFETFLDEHSLQQKALHDQMMASVRDMFARGTGAAVKKGKAPSNRVSLGTVNSLVMYLSANQRLVTSLICDIAEGRIGKATRRKAPGNTQKIKNVKAKKGSKIQEAGSEFSLGGEFGLKKEVMDDDQEPTTYFYTPRDVLNSLEHK